ncbi:hypothetical protein BDM02DRAFT_1742491 [Thelephora ganbajun]|uniref:Uncharacterized protein n=1 Tax=Thelephora ganbajun TaxID=370292 RepID=A0ACB6Z0V3_THEGA|nr:hypothetical protein BDM02DRAFT_1742491 [Thelephora ganbajun]
MGRLHEHRWAKQPGAMRHLREHGWDTPSESSGPVPRNSLREGWVKGPEGKHLLWLPVEWRNPNHIVGQSRDGTVLGLELREDEVIIIKF